MIHRSIWNRRGLLRGARRARIVAHTLCVMGIAACAEEDPTSVGGSLLPGQAIRTIEVILDASDYLVRDTAFTGYTDVFNAGYFVLANQFDDAFDANAIAQFEIPTTIAVADSTGTLRQDSMPILFGGRIVLLIDTLRSSGTRPVSVHAYAVTEEWHAPSASWLNRVDTTGVQLQWSMPGARGGEELGSGTWEEGVDSLVIPIDSATIVAWSDTTAVRSAVLVVEQAGARLRASDFVLRVDARSTVNPDTVVTTTVRPPNATFLPNPVLTGSASSGRMGGNPAWRTYYEFRADLDTLTVPCTEISPQCRVALRDADITYAAMQLVPTAPPPGFLPEDSMQILSRLLLVQENIPLARSPLGAIISGTVEPVRPVRFRPPIDPTPIDVPVTSYLRALTADTADAADAPPRWLALHPAVEAAVFGLAAFEELPRLRLVLTIASELQLR